MKLPRWLLCFGFFVFIVACATSGMLRAYRLYSDRVESQKLNVQSSLLRQSELQKEEASYSALNRNSDQMKKYRLAWQERMKLYGSKDAILEILRGTTAAQNLQTVETAETNRVIENNAKDFRIMWRFSGRWQKAVEWFHEMQARIDTIAFEQVRWVSRDGLTVEVRCEAVVRLQ